MNVPRILDYFTASGAAAEEGCWSARLGSQGSQIRERCRDPDKQIFGVTMIHKGDAHPDTERPDSG